MKKFSLKMIWILWLLMSLFLLWTTTNAKDISWYTIVPELTEEENNEVNKDIEEIWKTAWGVMEEYEATAYAWSDNPWKQIASWIMNWDTIIEYLKYVVKFLSEVWMAVGVIFIMYAWYKFMTSVFNWLKPPTETLKNAIIWVIIVIFSFAILRTLTSMVWIN